MTVSHGRTPTRRRLGTAEEALAIIPISKCTFYERVRAGNFPGAVRVGRRVFVDLDELETWIAGGGDEGASAQ